MREQDKVIILFDDDSLFTIDCTTEISPQYNSRATQHIIENGSAISDQIITDPVTLTINSMQSELEGQTGGYDPDFVGGHIELDNRLLTAWQNRETLYIDTRVRGVFGFMAITSYAPTTGNNHGKSLHFTLTLQELSFSETEVRNLAQERIDAENTQLVSDSNAFWSDPKRQGTVQPRAADARLSGQAQAASLPDIPENAFRAGI